MNAQELGNRPASEMTYRQAIVLAAMQGMLAYPGDAQRGSHHNNNTFDGVAEIAGAYANAILAREAQEAGDEG